MKSDKIIEIKKKIAIFFNININKYALLKINNKINSLENK